MSDRKVVMAIACHPDDIEFGMAGTLLRLKNVGYEVHYMNIANGSLGTEKYDYPTIVKMRREEAVNACALAGFNYHESLCDDLEVFYNQELFGRLVPEIREVKPTIVLTHGSYDYMEDHINAGRLAVSAVFCRGMQNAKCSRKSVKFDDPVTLYHSMPHSLMDEFRRPVIPGIFVDITNEIEVKKQMLACHKSQQSWLDISQGNNAYIQDLVNRGEYFGKMSRRFTYAEGWIRHNSLGFCAPDDDPVITDLAPGAFVNEDFEKTTRLPEF